MAIVFDSPYLCFNKVRILRNIVNAINKKKGYFNISLKHISLKWLNERKKRKRIG